MVGIKRKSKYLAWCAPHVGGHTSDFYLSPCYTKSGLAGVFIFLFFSFFEIVMWHFKKLIQYL